MDIFHDYIVIDCPFDNNRYYIYFRIEKKKKKDAKKNIDVLIDLTVLYTRCGIHNL